MSSTISTDSSAVLLSASSSKILKVSWTVCGTFAPLPPLVCFALALTFPSPITENMKMKGTWGLKDGVHHGHAGCGKLIIATDATPDELRGLRSIQSIYALIAQSEHLDITLPPPATASEPLSPPPTEVPEVDHKQESGQPSTKAMALDKLASIVEASTLWPGAISIWRRFMEQPVSDLSTTVGWRQHHVRHTVRGDDDVADGTGGDPPWSQVGLPPPGKPAAEVDKGRGVEAGEQERQKRAKMGMSMTGV
ncbi:unnamed protein product, partial [Discosporangium mesarthrocarpum]